MSQSSRSTAPAVPITIGLIIALAFQNAVPPFATDMYSPAFPQVAAELHTSAAWVGFTLTSFFIGMGLGQVLGGSLSDQYGRRRPLIIGGLVCVLGSLICMVSPSIAVLLLGRLLQGLGGGVAAVAGRAVLVDVAEGEKLAQIMSILMAVGGLAPMIAPVLGGLVLSIGTWRTVFLALSGFAIVMTAMAFFLIPETLPVQARHSGGLQKFFSSISELFQHRRYLGYVLMSAMSSFTMFAYISSSSFILQEMKGFSPLGFSIFFAANAGVQVLLSFLNAYVVAKVRARKLIGIGLSLSVLGVTVVTVSVLGFDVELISLCVGFVMVVSAQAFIFGNSSALSLGDVRHLAGVGSALMGLVQAISTSIAAPLASSGGGQSAVPMVCVMIFGILGAWACYLWVGKAEQRRSLPEA